MARTAHQITCTGGSDHKQNGADILSHYIRCSPLSSLSYLTFVVRRPERLSLVLKRGVMKNISCVIFLSSNMLSLSYLHFLFCIPSFVISLHAFETVEHVYFARIPLINFHVLDVVSELNRRTYI